MDSLQRSRHSPIHRVSFLDILAVSMKYIQYEHKLQIVSQVKGRISQWQDDLLESTSVYCTVCGESEDSRSRS